MAYNISIFMAHTEANVCHDDVIKWKIFRVTGPLNQSLMFPWICAWINGWANNRDAVDLRRYCTHHDVEVMVLFYYLSKASLLHIGLNVSVVVSRWCPDDRLMSTRHKAIIWSSNRLVSWRQQKSFLSNHLREMAFIRGSLCFTI